MLAVLKVHRRHMRGQLPGLPVGPNPFVNQIGTKSHKLNGNSKAEIHDS